MADSAVSDQELVEELQRFGETVKLPIKKEKRIILIKKLNHLRSKQKSQDRPSKRTTKTPNLYVVSSDDSDIETESAGQADRRRPKSRTSDTVARSFRRRSTPVSTTTDSDRSSFSRPSLRSRKSEVPTPSSANRSPGRRITNLHERPSSSTPSRLYPELREWDISPSSANINRSFQRDDTFESSDSDVDESTYEVENKSVNTTFTIESNNSGYESNRSPYRSKYSAPSTNHVTRDSPANSKRYPFVNHSSKKSSGDIKGVGRKKYKVYPEHVSRGLVAIVAVFFFLLAAGYLFVRKDVIMAWYNSGLSDASKSASTNRYLLCPDGEDHHHEGCYQKEEVEKAMIIIKDFYDHLSVKAGKVLCGKADPSEKSMSKKEFNSYLRNMGHSKMQVERLYNASTDLIIQNPHWNVRALDADGNDAEDVTSVQSFESTMVSMGLVCRLQRSFFKVLWGLAVILMGGVIVFLFLKYLKWRLKAKEQERQQVYCMVEEIIDVLKKHSDLVQQDESSGQQPYLAVQHVRDQLLPPASRKALQPIWEKAVKFIEANESRIRLEEQMIEGEEFAVWRWIHSSPNGGKVWQGQAFGEHNDVSPSAVMFSPTPCLKIRNMFDADVENGEDWHINIEDAILEKCKNIDSISHIYVDKDSKEGCVYMKCSSCEAAGRARQALHGWWFDRRLVTVRYLKLDYYHGRFQDSVDATGPLLPSTNEMSSLSQPYYRSSLEMT